MLAKAGSFRYENIEAWRPEDCKRRPLSEVEEEEVELLAANVLHDIEVRSRPRSRARRCRRSRRRGLLLKPRSELGEARRAAEGPLRSELLLGPLAVGRVEGRRSG